MSAIASFIKLPKTALDGLRESAVPKKGFFGAPQDAFFDFLEQHGDEIAEYSWSGYVLATLLAYLDEKHQITLESDGDELGNFLTEARGATYSIFTNGHKQAFLTKLGGQFSEEILRDYYNEFNETDEPEIGKAMLDGIQALRQSLSSIDENSVIVFGIG